MPSSKTDAQANPSGSCPLAAPSPSEAGGLPLRGGAV
ncbi:hypothetical protein H4687_008502 [Streptomyces stelliscabiei]|uniref:Uncharacterized protein n=1 Tax=Streptomyces stelliscabiei TaxID=146820 RepID=A0A8I0PJ08_9ACTN|nr:hypothetical protein [Streptomyces stelliscabiei]